MLHMGGGAPAVRQVARARALGAEADRRMRDVGIRREDAAGRKDDARKKDDAMVMRATATAKAVVTAGESPGRGAHSRRGSRSDNPPPIAALSRGTQPAAGRGKKRAGSCSSAAGCEPKKRELVNLPIRVRS